MLKETNLDSVKEISMVIFDAVKIENPICGFIQHPYLDSIFSTIRDVSGELMFVDITKDDGLRLVREEYKNKIDSAKDVLDILMIVRAPWRLTWLKYAKEEMSIEDFSVCLSEAWVTEECPNGDANVSVRTSISWFKKANKRCLMNEDEYEMWENLPEEVLIYRGVSNGGTPLGLSWTTNKEKAKWFQHRFDKSNSCGILQKARVNKKFILAYFDSRGEEELIVDALSIKNSIEIVENH